MTAATAAGKRRAEPTTARKPATPGRSTDDRRDAAASQPARAVRSVHDQPV
eukprot:CAMPEP_0194521810 /NCGR_PEP_ID=MMETSP0253-20130528/56224_1 /TAXON_ID=2966 /ORGANISM="Noctiluca scintillans" /LENGTH=50 /DNA_ID=CAMNT_0039366193 /DNA_START=391 /DNA_END=543 /DNA_ORIENTATION=-